MTRAATTVNFTVTSPFPGSGTSGSPWQINSLAALQNLRTFVNNGNPVFNNSSAHYRLTNDIFITGHWEPIGQIQTNAHFRANFDGGGRFINLTGAQTDNVVGLFGYVSGGTIQNLRMYVDISKSWTANVPMAGIAAILRQNSVVRNCSVSGIIDMTGGGYGGGIAALVETNSEIINCRSMVHILTGSWYVGGIAGRVTSGRITNCYATGGISGFNEVGGIVGSATSGAFIVGNVALNSFLHVRTMQSNITLYIGRVAGRADGTLSNNAGWSSMPFHRDGPSFVIEGHNGTGISIAQAKTLTTYSGSPRSWGFSNTNDRPWQWGPSTYPLPVLYWENQATLGPLPSHLQ